MADSIDSSKIFRGFTLAELLIALLILGVIATFTIPKVLTAQQSSMYKAATKETVATIVAAYQAYQLDNDLSTNVGFKDLTPYMNYVKYINSAAESIDSGYTYTPVTADCSGGSAKCLKLHNGSMVLYYSDDRFGGTNNTNGIAFVIDPDGVVTSNTTNGPGKSIVFFLMYNGRVTDISASGATYYNGSTTITWPSCSSCIPPWFSWN